MTRKNLIELIEKVQGAQGSQQEINDWLDILEANVSHPGVSDLIFFSETEMTPEQIVDTALAYKPISL